MYRAKDRLQTHYFGWTFGHMDIIGVIYVVGKYKALPHGEVVPFFVCCSINFKVYNNYIKNNG